MSVVVAFGFVAFLIVVCTIWLAETARKSAELRSGSQDGFIHVNGRRYVVVEVDESRNMEPSQSPVDDRAQTVQGSSRVYNVEPSQIGSGQKRIEGK